MRASSELPPIALLALLALLGLFAQPAPAQAPAPQDTSPGQALGEDLRTTLALNGVRCAQVTGTVPRGARNYDLACSEGGRYRVDVSEDGQITVFRIVSKLLGAGLEIVTMAMALPSRALGFGTSGSEHVADVNRHLFAIIAIAGHDCDAIVTLERYASDDHIVRCRNGLAYRVHNRADGLLAIDAARNRDREP